MTGADLDYAEGLELWKTPAARASMYDERWVWSRAYSDEVQTGPSTPSFYTYLQRGMTHLKHMLVQLTGVDELVGYSPEDFLDFPSYRWYGARAYYNLALERERIRRWIPPFARDDAALWPFPDTERDEIRAMPFDWAAFFGLLGPPRDDQPRRLAHRQHDGSSTTTSSAGPTRRRPSGPTSTSTRCRSPRSSGPSWPHVATPASARTSRCPSPSTSTSLPQALQTACAAWLGDTDGAVYNRLVGGLQTKTSEENIALWRLARTVRDDPDLRACSARRTDVEIVALLPHSEAGGPSPPNSTPSSPATATAAAPNATPITPAGATTRPWCWHRCGSCSISTTPIHPSTTSTVNERRCSTRRPPAPTGCGVRRSMPARWTTWAGSSPCTS